MIAGLLDHQCPPEGRWPAWLLLGGRGAGKTWAGARWLAAQAWERPGARLALVGATLNDVRSVMVEGPSGLIAASHFLWTSTAHQMRFEPSLRRFTFPSGAVVQLFSAQEPERLRGPQFHAAWADEFCAWDRPQRALDMLRFTLRLGDHPRLCVTTTPKPIAALRALMAQGDVATRRAATALNAHNLAPGFVEGLMVTYGQTRLAAQELEGVVVEADAAALWTAQQLAACRGARPPGFERVVLALDPSATARGDACGMVLAGRRDGRGYVLADLSQAGLTPASWAARAVAAAQEARAHAIVAESNQGGEMVRALLTQAQREARDPIHIRLVHAKSGKRLRAEPVAALYEQGRVTHCGAFPLLEEEMMALGEDGAGSLDRADALVWALTDLLLEERAGPRVRVLDW